VLLVIYDASALLGLTCLLCFLVRDGVLLVRGRQVAGVSVRGFGFWVLLTVVGSFVVLHLYNRPPTFISGLVKSPGHERQSSADVAAVLDSQYRNELV
jgi:hypothetical protein